MVRFVFILLLGLSLSYSAFAMESLKSHALYRTIPALVIFSPALRAMKIACLAAAQNLDTT